MTTSQAHQQALPDILNQRVLILDGAMDGAAGVRCGLHGPEASVSAVVFHHPDCACFTADERE